MIWWGVFAVTSIIILDVLLNCLTFLIVGDHFFVFCDVFSFCVAFLIVVTFFNCCGSFFNGCYFFSLRGTIFTCCDWCNCLELFFNCCGFFNGYWFLPFNFFSRLYDSFLVVTTFLIVADIYVLGMSPLIAMNVSLFVPTSLLVVDVFKCYDFLIFGKLSLIAMTF